MRPAQVATILASDGTSVVATVVPPEGNRTEVFWVTGRPCWVPTATPIDIEQPDETVLAEVDRVWNQLRHVPVGGRMAEETETVEVTRQP